MMVLRCVLVTLAAMSLGSAVLAMIWNANDKFIKVGRSFDVDDRISDLKKPSVSGIKRIIKLRIFTATHQEIYEYEQKMYNGLRELNFQYYVTWSTECFRNESILIISKFLEVCGLEEVDLQLLSEENNDTKIK
jgi:hypothetical protein